MPSIQTVEQFVSLIESGLGIEAMQKYYAEHATMQENQSEPRVGKEALLKYEHAAKASVTEMKARCIRPILVSGEAAVIRWVFEYKSKSETSVRFEEIAYQRWEDGKVVQEQFFYDPSQFK